MFSVDGSKINLPRELINSGYKAPNNHQYYPQGLMSTLYNLGSGLIYDGLLTPDRNERICLLNHMENLSPGDVLVLERGYFSYLILTKAIEKKIHLIRVGPLTEHTKSLNKMDILKRFKINSKFILCPTVDKPHKNIFNILRAFYLVKKKYSKLKLVFCGAGTSIMNGKSLPNSIF